MIYIAHRGASGHRPENTMAAFDAALGMGAAAVEFDVQQTADGELVVIHDTDLRRLGGRVGRVGRLTFKQLGRVDVGSWFDPAHSGERVPLLAAVLDLLDGRAEAQLEVKQTVPLYRGIAERVSGLLDSRSGQKRSVVVSSFHHPTLRRLRELDETLRLGYLVGPTPRASALKEAAGLRCESVHISARSADAAWARGAHAHGMRLLVYTVNARREAERLEALGVDGVFTNYPELAGREEAAA